MTTRHRLAAGAGLAAAALLAGCVTVRESFPGEDPSRVWEAIVAVAETASYEHMEPADRWRVLENRVWVDPAAPRLEIYRELARWRDLGSANPDRASRIWRFQVVMETGDPPLAAFQSRGAGVPGRARDEADWFFAQVRALLEVPDRTTPPLADG